MSCLIPPACVFCRHYHYERNDQSTEIPSCAEFRAAKGPAECRDEHAASNGSFAPELLTDRLSPSYRVLRAQCPVLRTSCE